MFNIIVSAKWLEGIVGEIMAGEYYLVCHRKDLCEEFMGEIDQNWLMRTKI